MTNQYLLFLNIRGIAEEQDAIYDAAKQCGYHIIMLAPSIPERLNDATAFYQHNNNKDERASIEKAKRLAAIYSIHGVFSWTDTDVVLSSKIAEALGLPCLPPIAAYLARNKYEMRKAVAIHDTSLVPYFAEIRSPDDIVKHVDKIGFPAVLKPVSASGSKGIFVVNSLDEALKAFDSLTHLAHDALEGWFYNRYGNVFILESFIDGFEFSVEGVVIDHELILAGITDKLTTPNWNLEYRHIFPANYDDAIGEVIVQGTQSVVHALGLNNCPIHLEGKWTGDGFKLIEIAARIGGDLIHTHLIGNSLGINWLMCVIDGITRQKKPTLAPTAVKSTGIQFVLANQPQKFTGLTLASQTPPAGLLGLKEILAHNTDIKLPPDDFSTQRLGYALAEGPGFESVAHSLQIAMDSVL